MKLFEEKSVLLVLIALGLLVFSFNLLFLPNWAFVDVGTHLRVVERMLAGEQFKLVAGDLFPFWYYAVAFFFSVFKLPFDWWNHAWALVVFLPTLALLFLVSRKLFHEKFLLPLAFFLGNWWVLNYSSIAYIEPFLGLQLLLFFWLFLREKSGEGNTYFNNGLMLFVVGSMALTKLTGVALALPCFFLFLLLHWWKRWKNTPLGFQALLFLFFVFLLLGFVGWKTVGAPDHKVSQLPKMALSIAFNAGRFALNPFHWAEKFHSALLAVLNFPPNHCLNVLVFGRWLELVQGAFFYLFLPFSACCVFGWWKALQSKKIEWVAIALVAVLGFGVVFQQWLSLTRYILPRYTLPVWGLLALLFAKGYYALDNEKVKRLVFVSFVLFCLYSFAYTSYSTYRYHKVERAFEPGLAFVKGMPGRAVFAVSYVPAARIREFKEKSVSLGKYWRARDLNELGTMLSRDKATHVFIGCYRERFNPRAFNKLSGLGRVKLLYKDACSQVWKILDYNFAVQGLAQEFLPEKELEGATGNPDAPKALDECH